MSSAFHVVLIARTILTPSFDAIQTAHLLHLHHRTLPRLHEHRPTQAGGRLAATKAHKFGMRLRLDLMKGIGPFSTRKEAEAAEKTVAEALERRGHRVFWG